MRVISEEKTYWKSCSDSKRKDGSGNGTSSKQIFFTSLPFCNFVSSSEQYNKELGL